MKTPIICIALLCLITASSIASYEFRIAYDEVTPEEQQFYESCLIDFEEGKRESHSGGASARSHSHGSESTHKLLFSVSSYKTEKPNQIRFEYNVNDLKGEITTSSFPVEIKIKNFYFESHPNTPYILLLSIDKNDGKFRSIELPQLEPIKLEEIKVEPNVGDND